MNEGRVVFIGAGPGDPDLLTVKARRIIEQADVIIYAGSLVNPEIVKLRKPGSELHNSALLERPTINELMVKNAREGKLVARVHSGDPAIYGALREQADHLKRESVKYETVPGVSVLTAAAAALDMELTLTDVTQTVIVTRASVRVPVPQRESLPSLSQHQATMVIFTGIHVLDQVAKELVAGGYPQTTPVGVVYKATWPDQKIITGTLEDIARKVRKAKIYKTALIVVGEAVKPSHYSLSKLYDPTYTHSYRRGVQSEREKSK